MVQKLGASQKMQKLGASQKTERKLRSAQREMERKMLGRTGRDKMQTLWNKEHKNVGDILVMIKKRNGHR